MKRVVSLGLAGILLVGCSASPQSQAYLHALMQDCAAGNPNACAAVPAQQAQVQAEADANTTSLVTGLAILGAVGAIAASASSDDGDHHHYSHRRH